MSISGLRLRPFRPADEHAALAAHAALGGDGFAFLLGYRKGEPWKQYLERLADEARGRNLAPDRVPATLLAATLGEALVGRVSIRFDLNDWLRAHGGHIGYGVVPEHRRRGFAGEMLRQALVIARAAGVDRVLVVCDDSNVASATVIERGGGVLENVVPGPTGSPERHRRYWID